MVAGYYTSFKQITVADPYKLVEQLAIADPSMPAKTCQILAIGAFVIRRVFFSISAILVNQYFCFYEYIFSRF